MLKNSLKNLNSTKVMIFLVSIAWSRSFLSRSMDRQTRCTEISCSKDLFSNIHNIILQIAALIPVTSWMSGHFSSCGVTRQSSVQLGENRLTTNRGLYLHLYKRRRSFCPLRQTKSPPFIFLPIWEMMLGTLHARTCISRLVFYALCALALTLLVNAFTE